MIDAVNSAAPATQGYGSILDNIASAHNINRKNGFTHLASNEANFLDYGTALSSELQQRIKNSVGDEEGDVALQQKIADLFKGRSVLQSGEIQSLAKQAGLGVSIKYEPTTYIIDNKNPAGGIGNKKAIKGSIAVYTFTDPNSGASITIADANGNGALEMEEIFMNEILSGVVSDVGAAGTGGAGAGTGVEAIDNTQDLLEQQMRELIEQLEQQMKLTEEQFNLLMEQLQTQSSDYAMKGTVTATKVQTEEGEVDSFTLVKSDEDKAQMRENVRGILQDFFKDNYAQIKGTQKEENIIDYVVNNAENASAFDIMRILSMILEDPSAAEKPEDQQ